MVNDKEIFDAFLTLKERRSMAAKARRELKRDLRARLILIFGGKCELCKSTKNLEFHHIKELEGGSGGLKEREPIWILKNVNEVMHACNNLGHTQ